MKPHTLHIQRCEAPVRSPEAWLISGGNAGEWLAEICRWHIDAASLRILVLPRSASDSRAGSALVITGRQNPRITPAAAAFGCIGGKVFLPIDAGILPAVADAELTALCKCEALVFHPTIGVIACEHSISVAALLRSPAEIDEPFAELRSVRGPATAIASIGFRMPESLGEMMEAMRDDIGTEPLKGVPPASNQPGEGARDKMGRGLREKGLLFAEWLIGGKGGIGGKTPAFIENMRKWVGERLAALGSELERLRNKEIHGLLEQLDSDPDEALKHALPLSSANESRGVAPPGANLGRRDTDFNINNIRGGQAADNWNLPLEIQRRLREKYVRLAERERHQGRFRRAAYIYAQLLGDFSSSAAVLKEGNHWREAAIIHRDFLKNPLEAARCFVEARMLPEAIAIYEKERAWEQLAILYRTVGNKEAGDAAAREWVAMLVAQLNPVRASEILCEFLNEREEALLLLSSCWPEHSAALPAARRLFAMHADASEHDRARRALARFAQRAPRKLPTLEMLVQVVTAYPDRSVKALAEDTGRQQIADALLPPEDARSRELVNFLPRLTPGDRLLPKDVRRFLDRVPTPRPKPVPAPEPPKIPGVATLIKQSEHRLPGQGVTWLEAVKNENTIVLAGFAGEHIAACIYGDDGSARIGVLKRQKVDMWLVLAEPHPKVEFTFLTQPGSLVDSIVLPTATGKIFTVGTPGWAPDDVVAATTVDAVLWLLRFTRTGWLVSGFYDSGRSVGQFAFEADISAETLISFPPKLKASGPVLFAAVGNHLVIKSGLSQDAIFVPLESGIASIHAGPSWTTPHVAVAHLDSVSVCWLVGGAAIVLPVISDLPATPSVTYTSDGTLIVIVEKSGYVIEATSAGARKMARFDWTGGIPAKLLPGSTARTFTSIMPDGLIQTWRVVVDLR